MTLEIASAIGLVVVGGWLGWMLCIAFKRPARWALDDAYKLGLVHGTEAGIWEAHRVRMDEAWKRVRAERVAAHHD